jgi:hypothetical protein
VVVVVGWAVSIRRWWVVVLVVDGVVRREGEDGAGESDLS